MTKRRPLPEALAAPVTDLPSAKRWIEALMVAELAFHFDDDAFDCLSECNLSHASLKTISDRRDALYALEWGPAPRMGKHYCPIGYLLRVEHQTGKLGPDYGDPAPERFEAFSQVAASGEGGALLLIDRGDCVGYDYGTAGRYHLFRGAELLGVFDWPDDASLFLSDPPFGPTREKLLAGLRERIACEEAEGEPLQDALSWLREALAWAEAIDHSPSVTPYPNANVARVVRSTLEV